MPSAMASAREDQPMTMTLDAIRDAIRSRCLALHHRRGASASDILAARAADALEGGTDAG